MNDQIKNKININLIDFNTIDLNLLKNKNNNIICEYNIKNDELNKQIQILNCYEEAKKSNKYLKGINNEKEIKDNCELYLNEKIIDFRYKYKF